MNPRLGKIRNERATAPTSCFVGLSTVDLTYSVAQLPRINAKLSANFQHVCAGGPACNASVTFAFLGGRSALVTATGRHPLANLIRDDLRRYSVTLHDVAEQSEEPPPVSSIMVLPGGERSIVSANSKAFGNIDAQPEQAWLEGANVVLLDGHYMTACQRVSGLAHSRSIPVVLDCGSWKDGTEVLLSEATAVICSNDFRPPGATDAEDVFRFLTRFGLQQIAITRGPDPILFVDGPRRGELAVPQVDAVDTCGAGDIFHGAFCYVFAGGQRSFVECLDSAAQIASISCTYLGTRSWMKTRQAVVGK